MDTSTESSRSPRVTPAQVIALGLVAASIGWGAWVLRDRPISEEVELLPGTVLPSSELAIVEAAFDRAQLSGHRTEDGRVWVPRPRQSAYMRALVDAEALPREFGSSLRRALESNSPWQSRAAQEELLRVAVQEELAHVICSMPGIERAAVLYDVNDRAAFDGTLGGGPAQTASVNVRTQPDVELEPSRVQAIRVLVAASIAGLEPERVAVTDLRSGHVHAGPLSPVEAAEPPPVADPALARQIAHEHHLVMKVRQGLAFVKGAVVDVTVTFADDSAPPPAVEPNLPPRQQRVADANAPAEVALTEVAAVAPVKAASREGCIDSIVVSVAVPETWFDAAVRAARQRDTQMAVAEVDRQEEERLRGHILELLPPLSRADGRRVVITRFPVVSSRPEPPPRPMAAAPSPTPPAAAGSQTATAAPAAMPSTIGEYIDVTIQAVVDGRFGDVPREVWMVVTAKCSAILAYILFRSGMRREGPSPHPRVADADRRSPRSRIDWATVDDAHDADDTAVAAPRRTAA
jgi:type III secretory pathway lipoprotein EscJ